ncbi:MAG: Y-family DNA polymerase [Ferrimicrobium acidiphilum]
MILTAPRRMVVLHVNGLSLLAVDATQEDCVAIVGRGQIIEVAQAALRRGVVVGMRSSEAIARCPTLELRERDDHREEQWLARLQQMFDSVSPYFRQNNRALVAPLLAMTRYFETEARVVNAIEEVGRSLTQSYPQLSIALGIADSLFAASVAVGLGCRVPPGESMAFVGERRVDELLPASMSGLLREVGMEYVGDFQYLDESVVAARFGGRGLFWYRLCRLDIDLAVVGDDPTEIIMCTTEVFDDDTPERISFRLMQPLDLLLRAAEQRGLVLVKACITLVTTTGELTKMVEVLDGASATELIARLRWFEQASRPHRDTLIEARIEPLQWSSVRRRQLTFDRQELKESAILATLTRVAMLYGDDRVLVPAMQGGRSLREQGAWIPWSGRWPSPQLSEDHQAPWPGHLPGAAPSLVYQHPREVRLLDALGTPVEVCGDGIMMVEPAILVLGREELRISACFGPWVVVERWWERRRRRYVRLMLMTPQRVVLVMREAQRWWLEGDFG